MDDSKYVFIYTVTLIFLIVCGNIMIILIILIEIDT